MNILQKPETGFAQIKNEVLFDTEISMKAKGLFAYLYAKPDEWDFSGDRIASDMKEGRGAVYSTLKELENAGYLYRDKQKNGRCIYSLNWDKKPLAQMREQGTKPVAENCKLQKLQVAETVSIINKDKAEKQKKNIKTIATAEAVPKEYSFDRCMRTFRESTDKRFPVLAFYFEAKGFVFENKEQHISAVQRNIKSASALIGYQAEQIVNTMEHLNLNATFKWTLETVGKYIDEHGKKKRPRALPVIPMATHHGEDLGFSLT